MAEFYSIDLPRADSAKGQVLVENIVCNKANFKLYPVSDW